jgi:hypothetical protein
MKIPVRYLPASLSKKDRIKQFRMLQKSRRLYKGQNNVRMNAARFYTRKALPSYKSKVSRHILNARTIYGVDHILPNKILSMATGCSVNALKKIVKKGEGAYFSSGSRPNQTAQSWGLARLASAITAGKSAAVDYKILEKGCDHTKKAFRFATRAKKKYGYGHSKTRKTTIS